MTKYTAIDLFSGAGGLSCGLRAAGFSVRAAVEFDGTSALSYALNHPETPIHVGDIRQVTGPALLRLAGLRKGEVDLLTGCPPCQGFSTLRRRRRSQSGEDLRNDLVFEVLRLARSIRPRALVMENVPGLLDDARFDVLVKGLRGSGYHADYRVIDAQSFGVPQRRKRLVLVAMRGRQPGVNWRELIGAGGKATVRSTIGSLPLAGLSGDRLHDLPEKRSASVMARIRATPPDGGSRRDVPRSVDGCACHSRCDGFSDVYGRMEWDDVAPTVTSGCSNPSKGRFLHPVEHRAITLREAALLQAFPADYQFDLSRGKEHVARQIGNAFPPRMIEPIVRSLFRGES